MDPYLLVVKPNAFSIRLTPETQQHTFQPPQSPLTTVLIQ